MPTDLKHAWTSGEKGKLCPLETMKAWALWQVYKEEGHGEKGIYVKIAEKLHKVGGGAPGPDAVRKLLLRIRADPDWYPGKETGAQRGRKRALSAQARGAIARSAKALKASDLEPTYPLIVARCPKRNAQPAHGESGGQESRLRDLPHELLR